MADEEKKDDFAVVKTLMSELGELTELKRDMDEMISSLCAEEIKQMKEIDKQIEELQSKREVVQASMKEKAPDVHDDLTKVASDLAKKESALKKAVYALPIELARKGFKLKEGKVKVSSSRVTTKVDYSEKVLDDHPEFDELYVDGDPLVVRRVNPNVLERLVAEGQVDEEAVKPYRIETKVRNQQVRISVVLEK